VRRGPLLQQQLKAQLRRRLRLFFLDKAVPVATAPGTDSVGYVECR
jgi:hypothetical protein